MVGAGCAGLSLAWYLMEEGLGGRRVVLLDPRSAYDRDRTWCSWNTVDHPFSDLVAHRWSRWRVRAAPGGSWVERRADGLDYEYLPSLPFYRRVVDRIERTPGIELRLDTRVHRVREQGDGVVAETDRGVFRGRLAFDSRPSARLGRGSAPSSSPRHEIVLLQHFQGWHVRTPRPVFEEGVATLMDFAPSRGDGVHFFYVLPFSDREALVEATWFGERVLSPHAYRRALTAYLRDRLGAPDPAVLHTEEGVIPMSTALHPLRAGARIYRTGLPAGMAKPSTGYAFQAIQRFSREMARRLSREALPEPPEPRPWVHRFQDRIFLSYLARHPERAAATMTGLFERVGAAALVYFLSDAATASQSLEVMRAMPFMPLTVEVARSFPLWART